MKIAVGMSGGVDSSVAAWLLKEQGHDVFGVSMAIWDGDNSSSFSKHACYGPGEQEEIQSAGDFCRQIGIPFHVFDCSQEYRETVLSYFKEEYCSGRTPNPCVKCNHSMKFGVLLEKAENSGFGFDLFATGHYARKDCDKKTGRQLLMRGKDFNKDQSYFLCRLNQDQLRRTIFPLGNMTKADVRRIASENNFFVADMPESQDFYSGDYAELLDASPKFGAIIDKNGEVIGKHNGTWNYTPGQRKGLGISHHEPLYVISKDSENNTVTVGTKKDTFSSAVIVSDMNWILLEKIDHALPVSVKVRSSSKEVKGELRDIGQGKVKAVFNIPQSSTAPGQSAVFYLEDIVVGGGIIQEVIREE